MSESITVHVNRSEHGAIDVDRASIETDRTFDLAVINHGEPVHLHVNPTEAIADALSVEGTNRYVDAGESTRIPITVAGHVGPLTGNLELATRFGANAAAIEVTLTGGVGDAQRVDVDEQLATPPRIEETDEGPIALLADVVTVETLALLGLVAVALLAGFATTVVVNGPVAWFGPAVVLSGVVVALFLLRREPDVPSEPDQ